jgi:putative tryptophan/tyrosine transport system substrate-binding protein
MNEYKKMLIPLLTAVCLASGVLLIKYFQKSQTSKYTIGIVQTISHPALNSACREIVKELSKSLGNDVSFVIQNAEGSIAMAQTIVKSLCQNKNINALATIGTLATQAAMQQEKSKPIIYCAVSDPESAGISKKDSNVAGISDRVDVDASLNALINLCSTVKTVAMIYNPSETNSISVVKRMVAALEKQHLQPLHIGVTNETEVLSAVKTALKDADAIWIPTDNTVACVMSMVGKMALLMKKPVISTFTCDEKILSPGILAVAGSTDYPESGRMAAHLLMQGVVDKCGSASLSAEKTPACKIYIHKPTLQALGIKVPQKLLDHVIWVN